MNLMIKNQTILLLECHAQTYLTVIINSLEKFHENPQNKIYFLWNTQLYNITAAIECENVMHKRIELSL